MWYFKVFLLIFKAKIQSTSHLSSLLTQIGRGGSLFQLGRGSPNAFYSLSREKIGCTLIVSSSSTLYAFPTFLRFLYSPTIWQSSLRLGLLVLQFLVVIQIESPISKLGSQQCLFTYCCIDSYTLFIFPQASFQTSSNYYIYSQASLYNNRLYSNYISLLSQDQFQLKLIYSR